MLSKIIIGTAILAISSSVYSREIGSVWEQQIGHFSIYVETSFSGQASPRKETIFDTPEGCGLMGHRVHRISQMGRLLEYDNRIVKRGVRSSFNTIKRAFNLSAKLAKENGDNKLKEEMEQKMKSLLYDSSTELSSKDGIKVTAKVKSHSRYRGGGSIKEDIYVTCKYIGTDEEAYRYATKILEYTAGKLGLDKVPEIP